MEELDIEITGKEKYKVESDLVSKIVGIISILLIILGIYDGDIRQGIILAMVIGVIIYIVGNILYIFTPFHSRKKIKRDKIYNYFKNRFYQINEFSVEKYEKVGEETLDTRRKSADDIMFAIYTKAYLKNADAVIIKDVSEYSKNAVFIKEKNK